MIKTFHRLSRERHFLNLIIASTKKQTKNPSNIIIIGERQSFSSNFRNNNKNLLSPFLFNFIQEVLAKETRQDKEKAPRETKKT